MIKFIFESALEVLFTFGIITALVSVFLGERLL